MMGVLSYVTSAAQFYIGLLTSLVVSSFYHLLRMKATDKRTRKTKIICNYTTHLVWEGGQGRCTIQFTRNFDIGPKFGETVN